MSKAPVPKNEEERIKALLSYNLLDTSPEKELDAITQLASSITGSPISLISLIDEHRQWFKSNIGLDVSETARDISFCQYAILQNNVFEVEDASKDKLFKKNPLVTGKPNIKFYAGAPLTDMDGHNLGTLCVIDSKAKKLTKYQKDTLSLLAKSVINIFALKKQNHLLHKTEKLLSLLKEVNAEFITSLENIKPIFDKMLNGLLTITESEYGFIGEILHEKGKPYLKTHAITDLSWDKKSKQLYNTNAEQGLEFRNLNTLFGYTVKTGKAVISNDPKNDKKSGGLPHGHPPLHHYLGVPINDNLGNLIGMVGIGNKKGGYSKKDIDFLQPFTSTYGSLIIGIRINTERKRISSENERIAARLIDAQSIAKIGSWEFNTESNDLYWSQEHYKIFELEETPADKLYEAYRNRIHPEDIAELDRQVNNVLKKNVALRYEHRALFPDGRIKYVLGIGTAIKNEKGKIVGIKGTVQDTTEQKRREAETINVKQEMQNFFDLSNDFMCVGDFNGIFKSVNNTFSKELGFKNEYFIDKPFINFVHPDDVEGTLNQVDKLRRGRLIVGFETRFRTKKGGFKWISWRAAPNLRTGGIFATGRNITEQKEFEQKLEDALVYLSAILDSTEYSIIATDLNGIITHFNKGSEKLLGLKAKDIIGIKSPEIFLDVNEVIERSKTLSNELGIKVKANMETFIAKAKMYNKADLSEWTYVRKDNKKLPVSLSITGIKDNKNNTIGYLGIARDISKEKAQEKEIIKAKDEALYFAKLKQDFLANMSHEIRTPLNAIIGFSRLLAQHGNEKEVVDYAQTIYNSSENLMVIVNDILDVSKLESGKLLIENTSFDVNDLVNSTVKTFANEANKKGLKIIAKTSNKTALNVMGDPYRINQILNNLISNAIKFTNKGEIIVSALPKKSINKQIYINFSVKDTGIGIPKNKHHLIFKSFIQADNDTTRKYGGTGLGLNIVQNLVQLMGGEIALKSKKGKGSEFYFTLPLTLSKSKNTKTIKQTKQTVDLSRLNVLLVEDNVLNQKLAGIYLKQFGCSYDIANNGKEAIYMEAKNQYDIILMDIQMPIMDGISAATEIRKRNKHTRIIAMTAHVLEDEQKKYKEIGMDGYLPKPFKIENLIEILNLSKPQKVKRSNSLPNSPKKDSDFLLDFTFLINEVGNEKSVIKEFVILFKDLLVEYQKNMKDFLINKDLSIAQKAAHKIVSSCELLGLSKMKKTLIEIEKMASQKNNYSKIVEKNKLINLYIEKISPQIEKTIAEN